MTEKTETMDTAQATEHPPKPANLAESPTCASVQAPDSKSSVLPLDDAGITRESPSGAERSDEGLPGPGAEPEPSTEFANAHAMLDVAVSRERSGRPACLATRIGALIEASRTITCFWCGDTRPKAKGGAEAILNDIADHFETCLNNPVAKLTEMGVDMEIAIEDAHAALDEAGIGRRVPASMHPDEEAAETLSLADRIRNLMVDRDEALGRLERRER